MPGRRRRAGRRRARAPAGVHRSRRHRRVPLDPRRSRRPARRPRRRLRPGGEPALRRRGRARVLPRAARAAARRRRRGRRSRCATVVERRRARRRRGRRGRRAGRGGAGCGARRARSRSARTACASASTCCADRRGDCSSTSATTARWCGRWRPGARVLNLFGYTGGFSIYAAAGGARATVTVDAAAPAIAAARRNFERNRLAMDARRLRGGRRVRVPRAGGARRRALRHRDLGPAQLRAQPPRAGRPACAPTGACIACARRSPRRAGRCARRRARATSTAAAFLATVRDGARDAGRRFALVELRGAGADHPVVPQFPEGDYLKFAVGVL